MNFADTGKKSEGGSLRLDQIALAPTSHMRDHSHLGDFVTGHPVHRKPIFKPRHSYLFVGVASKLLYVIARKPNIIQFLLLGKYYDVPNFLATFTDDYKPSLNDEGMQKLKVHKQPLIASGIYKVERVRIATLIRLYDMPVSAGKRVLGLVQAQEFQLQFQLPILCKQKSLICNLY